MLAMMACAAFTACRDSFVRSFVAAACVRPRAIRLGRDDQCIGPSVRIYTAGVYSHLPATPLHLMLLFLLSDVRYQCVSLR